VGAAQDGKISALDCIAPDLGCKQIRAGATRGTDQRADIEYHSQHPWLFLKSR
jgi:hypothetical protein